MRVASARRPDLVRETLDGDAPALLRLGTCGAGGVDAQALLQHGEHAGRDDAEDRHGDEEVGKMHEESVGPAGLRVNVPNRGQWQDQEREGYGSRTTVQPRICSSESSSGRARRP